MISGKKIKGTATSIPAGISLGICLSLVITFATAALLTWLELKGVIADGVIGFLVMGVLFLASALGSLLSVLKTKRRWMLVCLINGGMYFLILLGLTAVFFGGNYQGVAVAGLLIFAGSLMSGILAQVRIMSRHMRIPKYHSC